MTGIFLSIGKEEARAQREVVTFQCHTESRSLHYGHCTEIDGGVQSPPLWVQECAGHQRPVAASLSKPLAGHRTGIMKSRSQRRDLARARLAGFYISPNAADL